MSLHSFNRYQIVPIVTKYVQDKKGTNISRIDILNLQNTKPETLKKELDELFNGLGHERILLPSSIEVPDDMTIEFNYKNILGCVDASTIISTNYTYGLPEKAVAYISFKLLDAIEYLAGKRIVHRSIMCPNILINKNGIVKLVGFHTAVSLNTKKHWIRKSDNINEYDPDILKDCLNYLAPEVLKQDLVGYHCSSDIYSLGITICTMINGFTPFSDMPELEMLYEKYCGTRPKIIDSSSSVDDDDEGIFDKYKEKVLSKEIHDVVVETLDCNPETRITLKKLKQHPFFVVNGTSEEILSYDKLFNQK
uniref:Protein kinase domain-containing protein n=1 Tax=Strongyloides venezuelensis TaxID=75913 RepID=A0A0K0F5I9_STRVS